MPRIEPVPEQHLDQEAWCHLKGASASGKASESDLGRIIAYHGPLFSRHVDSVTNRTFDGLLGPRLLELIRLRSAQLGGCQMCAAARYADDVGDAEVSCMLAGTGEALDEREQRALRFVTLFHTDHHAIDDSVYRSLHEVFDTAEIIELGMTAANLLGMHRWLHTLDLMGVDEPAITFDPAEVHRG